MEQVFGIDQYLGYANMPALQSFGGDVYNRPAGGRVPLPGQLLPGDAGSTGKAVPLRVHVTLPTKPRTLAALRRGLERGLRVAVRLTGSDRRVSPVRVRLVRRVRTGVYAAVATTGRPRLLKNGSGTLPLRLSASARRRLTKGTYVALAEVIREHEVRRQARVSIRVR